MNDKEDEKPPSVLESNSQIYCILQDNGKVLALREPSHPENYEFYKNDYSDLFSFKNPNPLSHDNAGPSTSRNLNNLILLSIETDDELDSESEAKTENSESETSEIEKDTKEASNVESKASTSEASKIANKTSISEASKIANKASISEASKIEIDINKPSTSGICKRGKGKIKVKKNEDGAKAGSSGNANNPINRVMLNRLPDYLQEQIYEVFTRRGDDETKKYECLYCPKASYNLKKISLHVVTHNPLRNVFKCMKCPEMFYTKAQLAMHKYIYMCCYCMKDIYDTSDEVVTHLMQHKVRPHDCVVYMKIYRHNVGQFFYNCILHSKTFVYKNPIIERIFR